MKALVLDGPDAPFRLADIPRPVAGDGQVLVRIHASGVNPLDTKIRAGAAPHARHPFPAILGIDLARAVEAVGPNVDGFRPGDAVYGMTGGVGLFPGSIPGISISAQ
jgi:NADPH2:quinone reductase